MTLAEETVDNDEGMVQSERSSQGIKFPHEN